MGEWAYGRMGVMAMKWPNRIAQGFNPGFAPVRNRPEGGDRRSSPSPLKGSGVQQVIFGDAFCFMPDRFERAYRALFNGINYPGLKPWAILFRHFMADDPDRR